MSSMLKFRYLLPIVFCALYCLLSPAVAGTVYLKNGRVIRGPVVERNDEGVVIGLPGGKMRIFKRFITAVVYDESDIATEDNPPPRRDKTAAVAAIPESAAAGLPEDPRELLERLKQGALASTSSVRQPVAASSGARPGLEPASTVVENEAGDDAGTALEPGPAVAGLAPQVEGPVQGSSLRPPLGWKLDRSSGLVRFVEPVGGPFPASLELLRLDGPALATTECLRLLREEHHSMLDICEILDEGFSRNSAGREVFEITSRGRFGGRQVTVHQRIIYSESDAWLLSAFRGSSALDTGRLLAQSIDSLRFAVGENLSRRQ